MDTAKMASTAASSTPLSSSVGTRTPIAVGIVLAMGLLLFFLGNVRFTPNAISGANTLISPPLVSGADVAKSSSSSSVGDAKFSTQNAANKKPYHERVYNFDAPKLMWDVPPKNPNGKRVIITGGAGFIGSQLGHHLHQQGYAVTLIDNMAFGYMDNVIIDGEKFGKFVIADVLDPRVRPFIQNADALYHFAALSALPICQSDPQRAMEVNVAGTAAMLEAVRLGNVKRFLFASTSAVYENNKVEDGAFTEDLAVTPHLHYSLSKHQSELLVKAVAETYNLDTVIFRFFNVYGPHQDFRRKSPPFTSYIVREIVNNRSPILHSDGKQSRDYIYLTDLLSLVTLGMTVEKARGETFNVASGKAYSVRDMYAIVAKAMGSSIEPVYHSSEKFWDAYPAMFEGERPIKKSVLVAEVNKHVLGSTEKATRILGWKPLVSMEEGLQTMANFIKQKQKSGDASQNFEVAWK